DGAPLFSTLPASGINRDSNSMMIFRSEDGGKSWAHSLRLPFIDRQYFAVDRTGGKYNGRIYIHANGDGKDTTHGRSRREMELLRSLDGGRTFLGPVGNTEPDTFVYRLTIPGAGVVTQKGTLLMPYWTSHGAKSGSGGGGGQFIEIAASTDGGESI